MFRIIIFATFSLACGQAAAQDSNAGRPIGRGEIPWVVPPIVTPHTVKLDDWKRFFDCLGKATGTENYFDVMREKLFERAAHEGMSQSLLDDAEKFRQDLAAASK